jgi:hypothetical protein
MAKKRKRKPDMPAPARIAEDNEWRSRCDYDTLCQAQEISRDKGRLSGAKAHARKMKDRAERISRLEGKIL